MTTEVTSSLRTKLAAVLIGVALLSALLVSVVGIRLIQQAADDAALDELQRQATAISTETSFLGRDPGRAVRFLRNALDLSGAALYEISPGGSLVLLGGSPNVPVTDSDVEALLRGEGVRGRREAGGSEVLFVMQPLAEPLGGAAPMAVVLGREATSAGAALPVGRRLLTAALIAVGIAGAVSFMLANRIARPMHELAGAARAIAKGEFGRRVAVDSDDEIGVVGSSFNRMAEELGSANERQREFFLSISHELRTPLTAIQGYAEAIEDGTAEDKPGAASVIITEAKRLTRLVSDLLDLARLDAGRFGVSLQQVDVPEMLTRVSRSFEPRSSEAGVRFDVHPAPARVMADPDRLAQVLANLVENALRYTPVGGRISLSDEVNDGRVDIHVTDEGLGLDDADIDRAFERQYLWGKYRGVREVGTGLGLAITKELSEAMGGSVSARPSPSDSSGTRFTVSLKAAS